MRICKDMYTVSNTTEPYVSCLCYAVLDMISLGALGSKMVESPAATSLDLMQRTRGSVKSRDAMVDCDMCCVLIPRYS